MAQKQSLCAARRLVRHTIDESVNSETSHQVDERARRSAASTSSFFRQRLNAATSCRRGTGLQRFVSH